jgi:Rps23 Pro-64 3,4-dihydroxylase Tpa1-like proline 4-hydroxylase
MPDRLAPLAVDPALDPDRIRPVFRAAGRVHLPGALSAAWAERLYAALAEDTPWRRSLLSAGKPVNAPLESLTALSEADLGKLREAQNREARQGFQYAFDTWPVSDEIEAGRRIGHPAEAFYDFLNSEAFLGYVRRLTGDDRAAYCDAQCTRYGPGDFLNRHDDHADGKHRLFAYVMNLTPVWTADWGGLLLFVDGDGHVAEGYTPAFNALNLFATPQPHLVSMVAPFAGAPRLAITGWVRARRP